MGSVGSPQEKPITKCGGDSSLPGTRRRYAIGESMVITPLIRIEGRSWGPCAQRDQRAANKLGSP
jgi:hypothetical protein